LLTLLAGKFDGIGDPARNEAVLVKNEFRLRHLSSGLRMHTRIDGSADPHVVLRDQCRHTGYLRDKLLGDMRDAAKIFVYQIAEVEDSELIAIYDALQPYGDNRLLGLRPRRIRRVRSYGLAPD
jgi:hypothetical protein